MARILQHMAVLIFVCLGETVAGSVISWHRSPGRNAIPLDWMGDLEAECYVFSHGTDGPHMKTDGSKFKEAPNKLYNPVSPYIVLSPGKSNITWRVAIVCDDDVFVSSENAMIRVTDEDGDRVLERLQILWVSPFDNYYSERKHNGYNITESVYAIKSRHNDLLYWVDIIKSDGTRSDDLVLLKRLQCRPGITVNGHHTKALYRKIKSTNSGHLYLSFSLKSYEDNGYLWIETDRAGGNVFVIGFCKTFGVKNHHGYEEKRGEIFYQRSADERVDLNIPHPEMPKSEKDRGGVDKPWDPIASLGVISLLLVTIYRCSPGTKVTNITKCKVVKMKGQHGGVVIAGDYATVNFHYHYAAEQARLSESRNC